MRERDPKSKVLWVLWQKPGGDPIPPGAPILSFLSPSQEEQFVGKSGVFLARRESAGVRAEAISIYSSVAANVGIASGPSSCTLRQRLKLKFGGSAWWFHPLSAKDPESSPVLDHLIWALTILGVFEREQCSGIRLVGAPAPIRAVFRLAGRLDSDGGQNGSISLLSYIKKLGGRLVHGFSMASDVMRIQAKFGRLKTGLHPDFVLMGFWDWSLQPAASAKGFTDKYLKALPASLEARGARCAWVVWVDRATSIHRADTSFTKWIEPLRGSERTVVLQRYLGLSDVALAFFDFRAFRWLWARRREHAFRSKFQFRGLDFFPIFSETIFGGALGSNMPVLSLYQLALVRALKELQPGAAFSFLEHFPHGRAFNAALKSACPETMRVAVQHGAYNSEKTYFFFDPVIEFSGQPDGCQAPHPDLFFAMGELAGRLALRSGYDSRQILVTGSPRFSEVRTLSKYGNRRCPAPPERLKILIIASLADSSEIDLIAAVSEAARDLVKYEVRLRKHPFSRIDRHPQFSAYASRLHISNGSLNADLEWADLCVFTSSTAAEEAFAAGATVWHWLPLGFNASAIAELGAVPRFSSVMELRAALEQYSAGAWPRSDIKSSQEVVAQLFGPADGLEAERIADIMYQRHPDLFPAAKPVRDSAPKVA
ncbi:MAG: hypothetical protein K1X83_01440 [Oligoflexia bacterium]|nr:hypothetical protein [Oligoflexia bacterium]